MNRPENGEVRQGSRIVTAAARQAVAREKARITGKRARQSSALEQAAVEWEKERQAEARKANEEKLRISRYVETCPLSFQQVSLQSGDEGKMRATTETKRVNMAGVCALSRRLMAIERARALGRRPVDLRTYALEQAGRRWAEERDRRKQPATKGGQKWRWSKNERSGA